VSKKTEKTGKNLKKLNREKKPIRIFKKTDRFGFGFISPKPKIKPKSITEPNRKNQVKPEKIKAIGWVSIFALK
jgi:ribosomal protein S18